MLTFARVSLALSYYPLSSTTAQFLTRTYNSPTGCPILPTIIVTISFHWTPSLQQVGTHIFCVTAVSTCNIQSKQVYFKFTVGLVGSSNPCPLTIPSAPTVAAAADRQAFKNKSAESKIWFLYSLFSKPIVWCFLPFFLSNQKKNHKTPVRSSYRYRFFLFIYFVHYYGLARSKHYILSLSLLEETTCHAGEKKKLVLLFQQ